jgi:ammonia channel protein AmtB
MVSGVSGVGLTGVFASLVVNAAGATGGRLQLGRQTLLALVALGWPFVMTWIVLWVTDKIVGLKVGPDEQVIGLDLGEHGEHGEHGYRLSTKTIHGGRLSGSGGGRPCVNRRTNRGRRTDLEDQ